MTVLIPLTVLGFLVAAVGLYFATHEGKVQQSRAKKAHDRQDVKLPERSPILTVDPDAEQPMRGVPLHS